MSTVEVWRWATLRLEAGNGFVSLKELGIAGNGFVDAKNPGLQWFRRGF